MTVVAQWAKAPGIHCYVAGSIPAVTHRYCTKKIEKCSLEHKKTKEKKNTFRVILNNVRKSIILTRFFIFDLVENMLNDIIADFFWLV